MGSGSRFANGNAFIKAFEGDILKKIGLAESKKLDVMEEGLMVVDGWEEVHYYIIVRSPSAPEITFRLISQECIFMPDMDMDEELVDRVKEYTDLTRDEIELKIQEAKLR